MADNRWEPKALATAQVDTVTITDTPGPWATGDTITLTINQKALVVTIGSLVTVTQVATTIKEAWNGETFTDSTASVTPANGGTDIAEHNEITATSSAGVVTLTHDIRGRPFTLDVSDTAANGTATDDGTITAATGPNHADNTANWSDGSLPGSAADDIFIDNTDVSLLYGLDNLPTTADVASLQIGANFTGDIGLPKTNPAGYTEYLEDYMVLDATIVKIGFGDGSGSGRIKLNLGAAQSTISVEQTGSPAEFGLPAVIIKGTHASNTLDVLDGTVGLSVYGGEAATIATARIAGGTVEFGEGCSLTTINNTGGTFDVRDNVTTITQSSGTANCYAEMTVTTITQTGGTVNYNSSGTVTTLTIGGQTGALFDVSGDNSSRTVTTCNLNAGSTIVDPLRTISFGTLTRGSDVEVLVAT